MHCRAIANGALRKIGRLGSGREARPVDAMDTLAALQGLYRSWIAAGLFGRLCDVTPVGEYTAGHNERIVRIDASLTIVKLPAAVGGCGCHWNFATGALEDVDIGGGAVTDDYGQTIEFEARDYREGYGSRAVSPTDCSVVTISDLFTGQTIDLIYDGSIKQWQRIDGLTLDSEAPRSFADPQGLQACLAMEVADLFGADVPAATITQARRFQQAMASRWSMPRREVVGVYV